VRDRRHCAGNLSARDGAEPRHRDPKVIQCL
jgi:hypothetical protein